MYPALPGPPERVHPRLTSVLADHQDQVVGLALHPARPALASIDGSGALRLGDLANGSTEVLTRGNHTQLSCVAYRPDGRMLATGDRDGAIWLWDVTTSGRRPQPRASHRLALLAVVFSPDGQLLASTSLDGSAALWQVEMAAPPLILQGHSDLVEGLAFHPARQLLATASQDGTVRLWHPMTGNLLTVFFEGEGWVNCVAFSQDGRWLAGGLEMGVAAIWELQSGRLIHWLQGHQENVLSVAFSPDSRVLVTGGRDSTVRFWSVETGRSLGIVSGHTEAVSVVAFWNQIASMSGTSFSQSLASVSYLLATGSDDGSVRIWSVECEP